MPAKVESFIESIKVSAGAKASVSITGRRASSVLWGRTFRIAFPASPAATRSGSGSSLVASSM